MEEAYIVASIRTPGGKHQTGAFKDTRPEDLLAFTLRSLMKKTGAIAPADVEDIMVGCAFPEAEQGLNIGRIAAQIAGFPDAVSGATVNRFCASGLEAIALAALRVMAGWSDIVIGAGVESMTYVPMGGNVLRPHPAHTRTAPELYMSMGLTAENMVKRYHIPRKAQDEFAYASHMKAAAAQSQGHFTELVPTPATRFTLKENGTYGRETFLQDHDEGIRPDTTPEALAGLRPVFARNGTITAGNASQVTDGAAASLIMSGKKLRQLGIAPIARLRGYTTIGCRPDEMGVGPKLAIPKLLSQTGLRLSDIGLFEINEAFAAQALHCIDALGIDPAKVNVNGGAIALGHPLGCTGAKLCATLLSAMRRLGVRFGVESMCIGMGMGAAALFELCE
jgi:acetyl-CoA acyltransferase